MISRKTGESNPKAGYEPVFLLAHGSERAGYGGVGA
jgi:hypothetical protein